MRLPTRFALEFILAAFCLVITSTAQELEPWADQSLPVKAGLELWLDASRENEARAGSTANPSLEELPRIPLNGPLDTWHDASGKKRHLFQISPAARPRLLQGPQGTALWFDGKDDFLMSNFGEQNVTNFTLFIQASPRSNQGGFRAFLATSRMSKNDYSTGLNIDLGFNPSQRFDIVNIEGAGCSGFRDLLQSDFVFEQMHLLTITGNATERKVRLWVDGLPQQERERSSASHAADLLTVGARFYSNSGEPPHVQGFFDGEISQVLFYHRILRDEERLAVESFLRAKSFTEPTPGRKMVMLQRVTNSIPVRMFVPGFQVQELPLQLNNVNCVRYRQDGKLVALGYDGTIWVLSDNDGDGLEEKAAPFWNRNTLRAPIGMALTPPGYPRGRGVFVPSKGKLSLILDTNDDDVADQEIIVAEGWKELPHGVDALGVALDKAGYIYFGLGTANFTDPYLVDSKIAQPAYTLTNERGAILRVAPDFSRREIFCTGIRFPVALAVNSHGDLFCTDQEGATWLPNGNPFDELLLLQQGRHYGFPPRHPRHLPNVIDEPSLFDYEPQHQSTCGLHFNEPVNGGPVFGPDAWRDDALVAGYSRGKLYRTKLVKTPSGYVAQNQIIGTVNGLPADLCVSPKGDLVVAVHSGEPDWGSGPSGTGRLYKISYPKPHAPRPIAVWPASETETFIAFDSPLDPTRLRNLNKELTVTEARYAEAGDRFEILRPGYQVVANQLAEPRFELDVHSVALAADAKTLAIRATRRTSAVKYAISLPCSSSDAAPTQPSAETIELSHDLSGVEALWVAGSSTQATWLPHLDLDVARALTRNSATHDQFWSALTGAGQLTLRCQLNLAQMLQPAVQPGSKLDFDYPKETVTVLLQSDCPLKVTAESAQVDQVDPRKVRLTVANASNSWLALSAVLQATSGTKPALNLSWFTTEDPTRRALPLRRLLVPWARQPARTLNPQEARSVPAIAGGNWLSGRRLFFSEQVACGKCHTIRQQGGKAGPDLSNLVHRDYDSVLKDIVQPNAAINPDHVAYHIELLDTDEPLHGVLVGGDDAHWSLADATGRFTPLARNKVRSMKPSTISLMPEKLLDGLAEQQRKDLLTYLLLPEPLEPAALELPGAPAPRQRSEIEAVIGPPTITTNTARPLRIVLCAGPKDHGPGEHDYPLWQKRWSRLLALAENVSVETADPWPAKSQFETADVVVFYSNNPGWSPARAAELDAFLNRGGGLAYIHYAVDGHAHCQELAQRIGLAWRGGTSLFRHGPLELNFESHPITRKFATTRFVDESYWNLIGNERNIQLLASGMENGTARPLIWVREQGNGRVFVSIPGHYTWTFDDPLFRILIFRGIAWTARESLDRFNDLATIGARLKD